ncbi:Glycosyl transferase family 2 [Tissierella praeacuta DSM 18095]|uniref:Glycosyl transferase family 2 n=1 Tax=Tissierella praeacuta DSM 18095 TaxID=1123404 RepID=A0A1M4SA76_9FIRM|nr:glycosyltransferase [Tissierella praeacuta]TCU72942.1 glycosyl transferase family 2 [Tissierella praeacuta]SHE29089.1 Glycosyl transferase family 2 [Tissierella praeacuta DSM 18095]SUP01190.1 Glycosyl transferase family 2 [Tissierella praeacuta]
MKLGISVICSTNKTGMLENIIENFISQEYELKELIIGLNYNVANLNNLFELILPHKNIQLYNLGNKKTLGQCLNFCVEKSKYPIIAKFDDDDYYAPLYLSDTIKSLSLENVGIVGKSCTFVYFIEKKLIGIKNMSMENKYVTRVAGSTLMFKKELFKQIRFQNVNLGEDIKFCNDCLKIGYKIYSTNKYHYVYVRNKRNKHTWKIGNEYIMKQCSFLSRTEDYKKYIENSVNKTKKTYL